MFYYIKTYFKFLYKSTNKHGVHSPFVYNLVTKCFNTTSNQNQKTFYNKHKKILLESKDKIEVIDFGAGSKVFKNNLRKVSKIARVASINKKRALLLMRFMEYLKIQNVLELGTSLGVATACMSFSSPEAKIITLEGCKNTSEIAQKQFDNFNLGNIKLIQGDFSDTLNSVLENNRFDLIFFDGNHTKKATLNYFYSALKAIHNDTVFIFDDIHWSKEMNSAWKEIQGNSQVTVTIDTFQWGIVFFRKEQVKEHFVIRV